MTTISILMTTLVVTDAVVPVASSLVSTICVAEQATASTETVKRLVLSATRTENGIGI